MCAFFLMVAVFPLLCTILLNFSMPSVNQSTTCYIFEKPLSDTVLSGTSNLIIFTNIVFLYESRERGADFISSGYW